MKYPVRKGKRGKTPSFAYKVRESMDRAFYIRQTTGVRPGAYKIDNKIEGARFARRHGVAAPKIHEKNNGIEKIKLDAEGDIVLKPIFSTNSNGVRFLRRDGEQFHDLLTGEAQTRDQIVQQAKEDIKQKRFRDTWMVEDFIPPEQEELQRPDDLKYYIFDGEIGLILHKRTLASGAVYRWYDANWQPVTTGKYGKQLSESLTPPKQADRMSKAAIELSRHIIKPFMRIDLLCSREGPVFGEFTPHPGNYFGFNNEWNEKLGRLWEEAEARLEDRAYNFLEQAYEFAMNLRK